MILLDTTILVYALGDEHRLREPSRHLLELIRDGVVRASTTIEVIQEFCHVRARRRPRGEAAARALEYAKGLAPLLLVEEPELTLGLELFADSAPLSPFDAVLAATALHRGWALASADRAFAGVLGLSHLDPQEETFLSAARALG
ncbi:MAG TPA: type II toxin-antitoxin system VapC family toxin [Candidatus Micrarchaeaceae archaeon]|nr:type II toxin-antitoxin system VapC family toxin [Candidatus Micrarchaeaceae archaeon]HVB14506.1 type II toxin-antitoxin system VapC family toxin [Candidatus Dormibacteraeota bacterium]